MLYVYKQFNPHNFIQDFPSGIEVYAKSAIMQVYPLAYAVLGIPPETLLPIFIGFEYVILSLAILTLTRTIKPNAPTIVSILVIVLIIASDAREMNLARFGQNTFWGLYYIFADALRLFVIALILQRRSILSALLLVGSFTCHITMGLMGGVFILGGLLSKPREILKPSILAAGGLFLVLATIWMFAVTDPSDITGGSFPNYIWFELSKFGSFHWYPVDYGLFTSRHEERFIPFISFLILFTFYITRTSSISDADRKIIGGILAMLILVVIGVIFSVVTISPTVIKLSLHRANDLVVTVGLIYVVEGLCKEFNSAQKWRPIIAVLILISPFLFQPGFPLLLSILLVAPAWLNVCRGQWNKLGNLLVSGLVALSIILIGIYVAIGLAGSWTSTAYTGWASRRFLLISIIGLLMILVKRQWLNNYLFQIIAVIFFISLPISWTINQQLSAEEVTLYHEFKAAQIWSKTHTAQDALFMVDPTISYGWRDYSQRSSFGNLHEWLHTSWIYKSDFKAYQEGLRHINEFHLKLENYLHYSPSLYGFTLLTEDIKERYYNYGDEWRLSIANRYDIDYFVLLKSQMKKASTLPVVYQNDRFIILSTARSD
ncbi:MAG TPA: hypothetical protein DDZ80_22900 [Cyanobacteria bacterium UBA8803]|nr:hypothetical protein [Cyanobacteria bacterium UBA9273]HBL61176.1 hypothetical protein [Cyanobacteria bacterium UBA8803]